MYDYVEAMAQKAQESSQDLIKSYKATFNTPQGNKVLEDLKELAAIGVATGPLDSNTANYINGAQSIVWRIISYLAQPL